MLAPYSTKLSHVDHVIQEIVSTESTYVTDLTEVIDVSLSYTLYHGSDLFQP